MTAQRLDLYFARPRRSTVSRWAAFLGLLLSGIVFGTSTHVRAESRLASNKPGPRVFYTHGPPHAPNLLVVARAVSIDVAMRAAGLRRPSIAQEPPPNPGIAGERYTDDPLESPTRQTRVDPGAQLVPALREVWPDIGEEGARTLAAQFAIETGSGRHCYNFNLGNHKGDAKEAHMYLRGVWEGIGPDDFDRMREDPKLGKLVREESPADIRKKGHVVPHGKLVVILDPPHPGARFRAYASLLAGVERFAALHRRIGAKNMAYLEALRSGDGRRVARLLGSSAIRYYTGNVDAYAQGMANQRAIIDEGLGPIRP